MSYPIVKHFKNADLFLKLLKEKDESFWLKRGESAVLRNFNKIKNVSAYKDFLKKYNKKVFNVKNIATFIKLPTISKENYLRKYPFEKLFLKNALVDIPRILSTTSGSTGEPFYFPRTETQDWQYQFYAELYLKVNFNIDKKKTLYIDAFPMGPWIGGIFTYEVITRIARKRQYPLSIITTGIDIPSIIKTIKKMGGYYDQIIIGSYGPFTKEILDIGLYEGLNLKQYNIKFIFSAEAFPESFRNYVCNVVGSKSVYLDTLNHYGTVDLGTMSYETPICILIRRLAEENKILYKEIFGDIIKIPTLTQYLPELFYFESIDNNLYCTSDSAIPLARYDLGDRGDIINFGQMVSIFKAFGIDLLKEAKKNKIQDTVWKLPFVYVFERSDFSVSYYAFQVYPGPIRKILLEDRVKDKITGKFTLESSFSEHQEPRLIVNVELQKDIISSSELLKEIQELVHKQLLETHSEYKETIKHFGDKAYVNILLWENGYEKYFKSGTKQKWVLK